MANPCRWWTATGNGRGGALVLLLSFASLLLILVPGARAAQWTPADLPSPQHDPLGVCGHDGRKSAVCDPDGLLPDDAVKIVDGVVNFIAEGSHGFAKMSCAGHPTGYQVAVAVLQKMAKDWRSLDARAKTFATKLHDAWGVGDAECNNGVLLLVAVEDRRMYISTGKGVKGVLTDARVQQVLGNMKAALRAGRLDVAIEAGVNDIGKTLAGQKIATAEHSGYGFGVFVIAAVVAIAMLIPCFRRRSQYQKCRTALQRLESDRAMARQSQYAAVTCPICLEDFARTSPPPSPTRSGGARIPVPSSAKTYEALSSSDEISSSMRRTNSGSSSCTVSRSKGSAEKEGASSRCNPSGKAPARVLALGEPNPTSGVLDASGPVGATGSSSTCDQTITDGGSAKTPADGLTPETTQVLQCGHKFHAACLRSMLQASHDSCPICRKPLFGRGERAGRSVDDDTGDVAGSPDDLRSGIGGNIRGEQERRHYLDWAAFYPEYLFRLGRARYLYPRYVTVDMVDRWSRQDYDRPLATDGAFRALDPMLVSEARASGSGGSSFSFGGGGSSGGGGGGSSW